MDHMQTRHSQNWSEKIHTERWYCDDADHPKPQEFDEKTTFVNHLKTEHGRNLTQSQIQGRIRRNRQMATRGSLVCPLCDCVPQDFEKRIRKSSYKLWEHIADHLKSLAFFSLSYLGNDPEDTSSIPDSSKTSSKDDPRISRDSYCDRDLDNFDDIPITKVYSNCVQVEGEDFYEEASLDESENWDFMPVKSDEGTIKLWRAVWAVAFSPDGSLVASSSDDGTIKLWDVTRGTVRQSLEGRGGAVRAVAFSPDGHLVASGSADGTVKLWNTTTAAIKVFL